MLRNWFLSCSLVAAMLTGCNKTAPAPEAAAAPAPGTPESSPVPADNTAAAKVFEERILPIFKSPDPSSCASCHLASVDIKDYILPSAKDTFLALRDQGLIDLDKPGALQDQRVRCALSMAIDRQELIDLTADGILQVANGLFSPGQEGYLEDNGFDTSQRIDEAAAYAPLDQLCLSPQCGFSSTVHGNDIQVETQAAKLRLCVETAREVWGGL